MKKAIILFSGGVDSSTCLAVAQSEGYECHALTFNYGQKHNSELNAARMIASSMQIKSHRILELPLGQFGGSALTDAAINVPDYKDAEQIPITYVPARNTIFLSFALGLAEVLGANDIFIGVSSVDYSGYPDCRPAFIEAFEKMANLATKIGIEEHAIKIHTPLINLSKAETIHMGMRLGLNYGDTISCYRADEAGQACGSCDSCVLRKKGFMEAGLADPTQYQHTT